MTNVEKVLEVIKEKEFVITRYPYRACIKIEDANFESFMGNVIKFERVSPIGVNKYTLFIADDEGHKLFHNGLTILGNTNIPRVLWFKEWCDKIIKIDGLYI